MTTLTVSTGEIAAQRVLSGEEAQVVARQRGWAVRVESADGGVVSLNKIIDGRPHYFATHNRNSAATIGTVEAWSGGTIGLMLDGSDVAMAIWDGGRVLTGHREFGGRIQQRDTAPILSLHATHVAGTMIASGVLHDSKGMSPAGRLDCYDFNNDVTEMLLASLAGLSVSNHSYGLITGWHLGDLGLGFGWYWFGDPTVSGVEDSNFGFYSFEATDWDDIAYRRPHYLMVKSAGNDRDDHPPAGTPHFAFLNGAWRVSTMTRNADGNNGYDSISHAGVAKNILTVGAVGDLPSGYIGPESVIMSSFSGWGPADDGRIKPDVVANGIELTSSSSESTSSYEQLSGTSMSAPSVAGSVALLLQHYRDTHEGVSPLAATLKALIIHTADECGPAPGPDYSFGWGLMNTARAADVISLDVDDAETIQEVTLNDGQVIELSRNSTAANPIRVTLYWSDPPGSPPPDALDPPIRALVNDLDLRITGPNGSIHRPWILSAANPVGPATAGDNSADNIEVVDFLAPAPGEYLIQVSHKGSLPNRGLGNVQEFVLIATGFTLNAAIGACCSSRAPFPCLQGRTQNQCRIAGGSYGGNDSTCAGRDCDQCDNAICEACWVGTNFENRCPDNFIGNGACDCGCQFADEDCNNVAMGACCEPESPHACTDGVLRSACLGQNGAFAGRDTVCAHADCSRCDTPNCERCWLDTLLAANCPPAMNGDGVCDCGCQFADSDCGCGDGFCLYGEHSCSCPDDCETYCGDTCCSAAETASGCPQDCFDFIDAAALFGCYTGDGRPRRFDCQTADVDDDGDVDASDYKKFFAGRFSGP